MIDAQNCTMFDKDFIDWNIFNQPKQKKIRICSSCKVTETSCWYRDKSKQGHQCRKCYTKQNLLRVEQLPDGTIKIRSCITCQSMKATSWYHSPVSPGCFDCIRCYQKRRKEKNVKPQQQVTGEQYLQLNGYFQSLQEELASISSSSS